MMVERVSSQNLHSMNVREIGRGLREGHFTSVELTQLALKQIAAHDGGIHSFIAIATDQALAAAARADTLLSASKNCSPLCGIPYAAKDVFEANGLPMTCHSWIMRDHVSTKSADAVTQLESAGAVLIGKTAAHEFGYGSFSDELPFPGARNPHDVEHIPGGSSSGSAAAVAAGIVKFALGTDAAGSVRAPASYCGVVGFKPTSGLVSTVGAYPLSATLDTIGLMAQDVDDCALAFGAMLTGDARHKFEHSFCELKRADSDFRIGVLVQQVDAPFVDKETNGAIHVILNGLRLEGAKITPVRMADYDRLNTAGSTILSVEAFRVHQDNLRQFRDKFGTLTRLRLEAGARISSDAYEDAAAVVQECADSAIADLFFRCDAVVTLSTISPAPAFAAFAPDTGPQWAAQNLPFNVLGLPAVSVPIGYSLQGLPLALQIVGPGNNDANVLHLAARIEQIVAGI